MIEKLFTSKEKVFWAPGTYFELRNIAEWWNSTSSPVLVTAELHEKHPHAKLGFAEPSFSFRYYIFAYHPSHSVYSIIPSTMEQSTVESPLGATTDPTGTTNKLEKNVDLLNANMDRKSTFLGQLCQRIPTGEYSREVRETASQDITGAKESGRKWQRRKSSLFGWKSRRPLHEIPQWLWRDKSYRLRGRSPEFVRWRKWGSHTKVTTMKTPETMM